LIPRLRAEAELNQGEDLVRILADLRREIAEKTQIRDDLKGKIADLRKPQAKKRKKLEFSGIKRTNISAPPDPMKLLALSDFTRRSVAAQTECTNEAIQYQLTVLAQQRIERKSTEEMQSSLETMKQRIAETEAKVAEAKREGEEKEEKIRRLRIEIGNVKDELVQGDTNALQEKERAREYAQELERVDDQILVKQQQLEKVVNQVGALQMHLKEMQKFRAILESELHDLENREKPEVRQLVQDVQDCRIRLDETTERVNQMTQSVEAKRQALENLLNSEEMQHYTDLRIEKMNLERRIRKWTILLKDSKETLQGLESFSIANAGRRQALAEALKNKQKAVLKKEAEVSDLEQYAELLESLIREHKQNWMVK
jgi:chromosome segregation ATPase